MQGNGSKLHLGRFRRAPGVKFFPGSVAGGWDELPREAATAQACPEAFGQCCRAHGLPLRWPRGGLGVPCRSLRPQEMLRNPHFLTAPWGDSIQQSHPVQPGTPLSPKSAILGQLRFPSGFHRRRKTKRVAAPGTEAAPLRYRGRRGGAPAGAIFLPAPSRGRPRSFQRGLGGAWGAGRAAPIAAAPLLQPPVPPSWRRWCWTRGRRRRRAGRAAPCWASCRSAMVPGRAPPARPHRLDRQRDARPGTRGGAGGCRRAAPGCGEAAALAPGAGAGCAPPLRCPTSGGRGARRAAGEAGGDGGAPACS